MKLSLSIVGLYNTAVPLSGLYSIRQPLSDIKFADTVDASAICVLEYRRRLKMAEDILRRAIAFPNESQWDAIIHRLDELRLPDDGFLRAFEGQTGEPQILVAQVLYCNSLAYSRRAFWRRIRALFREQDPMDYGQMGVSVQEALATTNNLEVIRHLLSGPSYNALLHHLNQSSNRVVSALINRILATVRSGGIVDQAISQFGLQEFVAFQERLNELRQDSEFFQGLFDFLIDEGFPAIEIIGPLGRAISQRHTLVDVDFNFDDLFPDGPPNSAEEAVVRAIGRATLGGDHRIEAINELPPAERRFFTGLYDFLIDEDIPHEQIVEPLTQAIAELSGTDFRLDMEFDEAFPDGVIPLGAEEIISQVVAAARQEPPLPPPASEDQVQTMMNNLYLTVNPLQRSTPERSPLRCPICLENEPLTRVPYQCLDIDRGRHAVCENCAYALTSHAVRNRDQNALACSLCRGGRTYR
ncbi:hypothetical protein GpartN1_g1954.t1 [Galdieria partita]|uniref:Uncharacterized protein n=1 Tax=Galdieria partita TaxID=83374 RepID=A0A9C7UNU2_9RHOD|nr:hypothetical protein GpartN1_g1954.t1 [Galdieria partita]